MYFSKSKAATLLTLGVLFLPLVGCVGSKTDSAIDVEVIGDKCYAFFDFLEANLRDEHFQYVRQLRSGEISIDDFPENVPSKVEIEENRIEPFECDVEYDESHRVWFNGYSIADPDKGMELFRIMVQIFFLEGEIVAMEGGGHWSP